MSHFLVPMVLAVVLWLSAYALFRRYVWTLVALTLLTSRRTRCSRRRRRGWPALNGYLPEVARVVSTTLEATGIGTIRSAVQRGEAYANAVAAIPSLHSGVPMMVLLFSWPLVRRADAGAARRSTSLAMTFTLAYGGEHYVVDAFVGWAYAAVAVFGVARLSGRTSTTAPG